MRCGWVSTLLLVLIFRVGSFMTNQSLGSKGKRLPILRVKVHHNVSVGCTEATHKEMTFTLWHDGDQVNKVTIDNRSEIAIPNHEETDVFLQVKNHTAHFVLSHVTVARTGLYTCQTEILYPPPYRVAPETQVIVLVEEELCPPKEVFPCPRASSPWVMWAGACAVLASYGLVLTCMTAVIWYKLRSKECLQTDYMNMKPHGFRRHQGVMHPKRAGIY